MAAAGFGVWSLVGGALARVTARAILFCLVAGNLVMPSLRFHLAWPHIRFGAAVTLSRTLFWLSGYLDIMIVGRALTSHDLGIYNVSKSLSLLPVSRFGSILAPLSFSVYAKLAGDPVRQREGLIEAIGMLLLVSAPMAAIVSATGADIERVILGPNWVGAGFMLSVMSITIPCVLVLTQTNTLLMAAGTMRPVIINQLLGLVILGVAVGVGAAFGIYGAAVAWTIGCAATWVVSVVRTQPYTLVTLGDVLRIGRGALLSAALAYLVIVACRSVLGDLGEPLLADPQLGQPLPHQPFQLVVVVGRLVVLGHLEIDRVQGALVQRGLGIGRRVLPCHRLFAVEDRVRRARHPTEQLVELRQRDEAGHPAARLVEAVQRRAAHDAQLGRGQGAHPQIGQPGLDMLGQQGNIGFTLMLFVEVGDARHSARRLGDGVASQQWQSKQRPRCAQS